MIVGSNDDFDPWGWFMLSCAWRILDAEFRIDSNSGVQSIWLAEMLRSRPLLQYVQVHLYSCLVSLIPSRFDEQS